MYGDVPEYNQIEPYNILEGRYLNQGDIDEERKIAVIGNRVHELLYEEDEEVIGSTIKVQGVIFTVVGVYSSYQTGEDAEESNQSIFVPYSTFGNAFHTGDRVGWYGLLIDPEMHADSAATDCNLMKARKSVHPDDRTAFGHWTMASAFEEMETIFGAFRFNALFGGLALLAEQSG